jgi:hypothetical protein
MAEVRKRFSARSVLALNDSGDHPFGLPHIIDMESQVNGRGGKDLSLCMPIKPYNSIKANDKF